MLNWNGSAGGKGIDQGIAPKPGRPSTLSRTYVIFMAAAIDIAFCFNYRKSDVWIPITHHASTNAFLSIATYTLHNYYYYNYVHHSNSVFLYIIFG